MTSVYLSKSKKIAEETTIFLHIHKTGGTTLRSVLLKQFKADKIYCVKPKAWHNAKKDFAKIAPEQRKNFNLIEGHMNFGIHDLTEKNYSYVAFLRDPVDRIVSLYYYYLESPSLRNHEQVKNMTIEEFVRSGIQYVETDNGQVRLLSGVGKQKNFKECDSDILQLAKDNLDKHFSIVGLTERFDESLLLAKRDIGLSFPFYTKTNVTKKRPKRKKVSPRVEKTIQEYNQLDIELYDYATKLFEAQVEKQGKSFYKELKLFTFLNKLYKFYSSYKTKIRTIMSS